jgi:hypothetical protein
MVKILPFKIAWVCFELRGVYISLKLMFDARRSLTRIYVSMETQN